MSILDEVLIGDRITERISLRRISANTNEGWFDAEVVIQCDGWKGRFKANFVQGELSRFAGELQILYKKLKGEAVLAPLEPNLELSLIGDGKGRHALGQFRHLSGQSHVNTDNGGVADEV